MTDAGSGLQLQSTVTGDGKVVVTLVPVPTPEPRADEVVVRVEAAPINPSDLGLLFAGADLSNASVAGPADRPSVTASLPPGAVAAMAARVGEPMPVGNEGAGVVVEAGSSDAAQALLGKTVALLGGAMYSQYRCVNVSQCLLLPPGTTPAEGAACFVNPLTVLGMLGTMRHEDHTALVHTAAASNLGQMLVKACAEEGVPLVNVVRRAAHVGLLQDLGAEHVCDSSSLDFMAKLTDAVAATGATLAFDAIGGGRQGGQILAAMEAAAMRTATGFTRYGSTVHKQVYIYGGLDRGPTEINRTFGMAWGIGGWLLTPFLQRIGPAETRKLYERVAAGIKTTFASSYTKEVSLAEALQPPEVAVYGRQATGEKYLVNPNKGL